MSDLQKLTETARKLTSEAVWDASVLGYTKADLAEMDAEERAQTLYELLNQAADLAQAITGAFGADLKASGSLDAVKSAADDLIQVARKHR